MHKTQHQSSSKQASGEDQTVARDLFKSTAATTGAHESTLLHSPAPITGSEKSLEANTAEQECPSSAPEQGGRSDPNPPPAAQRAQPEPRQPKQTAKEGTPVMSNLPCISVPDKVHLSGTSAELAQSRKESELSQLELNTMPKSDTLIKQAAGEAPASMSLLGKRLVRDESPGMGAYKRIQEFAAKQYEFTPKVLTPAIFEKTLQLPPSLFSSNKAVLRPGDQTPQKPIVQQRSLAAPPSKTRQSSVAHSRREAGLEDYDLNLCGNPVDVQVNSIKCLENYLDLANLTYFGTQSLNVRPPTVQMQPPRTPRNPIPPRQQLSLPVRPEAPNDELIQETSLQQGSISDESLQMFSRDAGRPGQQKMSHMDFLSNPLRSDHPFELWSPKEMALFNACICRFEKEFDVFVHYIKTKTLAEIYDFYRSWKQTKYYRTWKQRGKERSKAMAMQELSRAQLESHQDAVAAEESPESPQ